MTALGDLRRASRYPVLVPNERGLDRALALGLRHVAIFGSATETFARKNLNRDLDESFAMFEPGGRRAREAGLDVRGYVSMCFGDPWEGAVPIEQVVASATRLLDLGCDRAQPRRHHRGRHRRPGQGPDRPPSPTPASAPTGSRCTSTTPTARRWPTPYAALAGGHHHLRRQRGRPRRLSVRRERHRQPRHRGPGVDAHGLGIEHGVDLDALVADQRLDGAAPRPGEPVGGGACPRPPCGTITP